MKLVWLRVGGLEYRVNTKYPRLVIRLLGFQISDFTKTVGIFICLSYMSAGNPIYQTLIILKLQDTNNFI